mgnify:CR=1 FL=1
MRPRPFGPRSRNWLIAKLASVYVEMTRNTPLLLQLFFWYMIFLELLPPARQALQPVPDVFLSNRGVRFPVPVPAGSRLRGHFRLLAFDPLPGGAQLTVEVTMELEGSAKPACVAESVSRRFIGPA